MAAGFVQSPCRISDIAASFLWFYRHQSTRTERRSYGASHSVIPIGGRSPTLLLCVAFIQHRLEISTCPKPYGAQEL